MNVRQGRNHGTVILAMQWHSYEHTEKKGIFSLI